MSVSDSQPVSVGNIASIVAGIGGTDSSAIEIASSTKLSGMSPNVAKDVALAAAGQSPIPSWLAQDGPRLAIKSGGLVMVDASSLTVTVDAVRASASSANFRVDVMVGDVVVAEARVLCSNQVSGALEVVNAIPVPDLTSQVSLLSEASEGILVAPSGSFIKVVAGYYNCSAVNKDSPSVELGGSLVVQRI